MATEFAAPFEGSQIATALQFRRRNRMLGPDGIDADYGSSDGAVSVAGGGTGVDIQDMRAIIQGALYELTGGPLNLLVGANAGGSNRFDIAVLTYDASHDPGVYARVIEGTAGAGLPALTNDEAGLWDFALAHWEKTPAGAIVNVVDRRFFLDGSGGVAGIDSGGSLYFPPAPRTGMRVTFWNTSARITKEFRRSDPGLAFWERIDPDPLLELHSLDGGDVTSTAWTGALAGAGAISGTFVAPLSGQVRVGIGALIGVGDRRVYGRCRISGPGVNHEPDEGSDQVLSASLGPYHAMNWTSYTLSGFTPGSTYTATFQFKRESGTNSDATFVDSRRVIIERA